MKNGTWLIVLLFLFACSSKPAAPPDLLTRDKMEDVLWDLMRADLFINNYMIIKDPALDKKKQGIELYTRILKLHNVKQEQFKSSFKYYQSQPEEMKVLMDSLSHRSDTVFQHRPMKAPVIDSALPAPVQQNDNSDSGRKTKIPVTKAE